MPTESEISATFDTWANELSGILASLIPDIGDDFGEPDNLDITETEIHTWFERDRAHVELRRCDNDATIIEWWDEEVSEAVEDGFLSPKDWHGTAYEYALSHDFESLHRPSMGITISTDTELSSWNYQAGDNSFTGACYSDPYWGVGTLCRDSDCDELAAYIMDDLYQQFDSTI